MDPTKTNCTFAKRLVLDQNDLGGPKLFWTNRRTRLKISIFSLHILGQFLVCFTYLLNFFNLIWSQHTGSCLIQVVAGSYANFFKKKLVPLTIAFDSRVSINDVELWMLNLHIEYLLPIQLLIIVNHCSVQRKLSNKDEMKVFDYHLWMSLFKSYITDSPRSTRWFYATNGLKKGVI